MIQNDPKVVAACKNIAMKTEKMRDPYYQKIRSRILQMYGNDFISDADRSSFGKMKLKAVVEKAEMFLYTFFRIHINVLHS